MANPTNGGAFVPSADYTPTGNWTFTGTTTLGSGTSFTTPTLTTPTIATGLTASGSASNDFSASTGTFKTSSGANQLSGAVTITDATTPSLTTAAGSTNTGNVTINGKTSGKLVLTTADATAQTVTVAPLAQTSGAATINIPDMAGVSDTFAFTTKAQTLASKTLTGSLYQILASSGNTTMTAAMSGATMLFDSAAGVTFTLPAAQAGLCFYFVVTVTCTSNQHKIITKNTGTEFMQGLVAMATDAATPSSTVGPKWFAGNGTSHVALTQAAASTNATGGLKGSYVIAECLSSTLWQLTGVIEGGSGATIATPWATS